jgi:hypothetical protein
VSEAQPVSIRAFLEAGRFDGFSIHAGDAQGILKGSRLDEVSSLTLKNVVFVPGELSSRAGSDELPMVATDPQAASALKAERSATAKVTLQDGRSLSLTATVDGPRPRVTLIGKSVQALNGGQSTGGSNDSNVKLTDAGELPPDSLLTFSIRTIWPTTFAHDESVDIATADESSGTILNLANGGLTLENSQVAVATLNPSKAFGPSTFGPLKFRVSSKGVSSDWQPLANLVRLPTLRQLKCPQSTELACQLSGAQLYLIDSVSGDAQFTKPVVVPDGFLGTALPVPHPAQGTLFIRLRDNPEVINPVTLSVENIPVPADDAGRTEARRSATTTESTGGEPTSAPPPPSAVSSAPAATGAP